MCLLLFAGMGCGAMASPLFAGGNGSIAAPWHIATPAQLAQVRHYPQAHFLLVRDLDLGGNDTQGQFWNDGLGWQPIGTAREPFRGSFDGGGHHIEGLFIARQESDVGLFGVAEQAGFSNLYLQHAIVAGTNAVGVLVGHLRGRSRVTGIRINGSVSGVAAVGGLAGLVEASRVSGSEAVGFVSGEERIGGLVGSLHASAITTSHTRTDATGHRSTGGLVGGSYGYSTVTRSSASGKVTGGSASGGLVGINLFSLISASQTTSDVTGTSQGIGALVGINHAGTIRDSLGEGVALNLRTTRHGTTAAQ